MSGSLPSCPPKSAQNAYACFVLFVLLMGSYWAQSKHYRSPATAFGSRHERKRIRDS